MNTVHNTEQRVNNFLYTGLTGFVITLIVNAFGILVFRKPADELFADDWWSTWFPSYAVWIALAIAGVGRKLSAKAKTDPRPSS